MRLADPGGKVAAAAEVTEFATGRGFESHHHGIHQTHHHKEAVMAFTQDQVLLLADQPNAIRRILADQAAYTVEQVAMAYRAERILARRAGLEIERRMAAYDAA